MLTLTSYRLTTLAGTGTTETEFTATEFMVERVSTKPPFPRGLQLVDGELYVLCGGRVREYGGVSAEVEVQAGTLYALDPNVADPFAGGDPSAAVRAALQAVGPHGQPADARPRDRPAVLRADLSRADAELLPVRLLGRRQARGEGQERYRVQHDFVRQFQQEPLRRDPALRPAHAEVVRGRAARHREGRPLPPPRSGALEAAARLAERPRQLPGGRGLALRGLEGQQPARALRPAFPRGGSRG